MWIDGEIVIDANKRHEDDPNSIIKQELKEEPGLMDDLGMDYMEDGMGMDYNNNMLPVFKDEDFPDMNYPLDPSMMPDGVATEATPIEVEKKSEEKVEKEAVAEKKTEEKPKEEDFDVVMEITSKVSKPSPKVKTEDEILLSYYDIILLLLSSFEYKRQISVDVPNQFLSSQTI